MEPQLTLNDILTQGEMEASDDLEASQPLRGLESQLAEEPAVAALWPAIRSEVTEKIGEMLDVPLVDVLRGAWNNARELHKYRDAEKYPPEESVVAPLAEHTVRSSHRPHLELRVGPTLVRRLDFELDVEIHLEAARLTIQAGRIKKIDLGEGWAKGVLSCEGFRLLERKSKKFALPGALRLGEGIEI